jgi:SAM-dependent methyltransferase
MKGNDTWEEAVLWLRDQPDQQELVRACYFDDPVLEAAMRYAGSEEWQAVTRLLPQPPGHALDIGAGRGISSYALARAGWQVDALEPDASSIVGRGAIRQLAEESRMPINLINGFAENISMGEAQYELVFGRQVLHHANNLPQMSNEIARVLKPGGTFIATREHVISAKEDLPAFLANHPLHHFYGGENAFVLQEYLGALSQAGLSLQHVIGPFDSPINYFPMTDFQWREYIQQPLVEHLGRKTIRLLLSEKWPWMIMVNRWLANRASKRSNIPGRLYSFVAYKPTRAKK